ncbi:hypothetical protein DPEC_G00176720 [Dallia pectoralis]|uniref:Uncharacterized protein n=1 Tax=Dallia pectoralis TaxID=75939 RepID=A0ACC2GEQ7_DALPE|nr:hypothetical protein DPEC_G00176720 [Dallia pectoralis]
MQGGVVSLKRRAKKTRTRFLEVEQNRNLPPGNAGRESSGGQRGSCCKNTRPACVPFSGSFFNSADSHGLRTSTWRPQDLPVQYFPATHWSADLGD